jgi:hypothetical protein
VQYQGFFHHDKNVGEFPIHGFVWDVGNMMGALLCKIVGE